MLSSAQKWAELVRLPSVLTVPGDVLVGTFAARHRASPRTTGARALGSCLVYLGGMALNDYVDRGVDAVERPGRPIPSGRIRPEAALAVAAGLTGAGIAVAAVGGGPRSVATIIPVACAAWAYDLRLKGTAAGPVAMAAARSLNVMHGAASPLSAGVMARAGVIGAHILTLTLVSRHETSGATPATGRAALAGTSAVSLAALGLIGRRARAGARTRRLGDWAGTAMRCALLAGFAERLRRAEHAAIGDPGPAALQRVVGNGVLGLIPLQASLLGPAAPKRLLIAMGTVWPAAVHLARRRPVT